MGPVSSNVPPRRLRDERISSSLARGVSGLLAATSVLAATATGADITEAMWQQLVQANAELRATVSAQQKEIAELRTRVDQLDAAGARRESTVADLRDQLDRVPPPAEPASSAAGGKIIFSGEAGVGFFAGTADSQYPDAEFRVDEATLRIEAEAARGVYLAGELQLTTRETRDDAFHLGEFYLEFEDVGGSHTPDRLFNVRLGRVDVPFGEEYQQRDVNLNPLITHSLSDVWGIDEGVELFGEHDRWSYAIAVQNGGSSRLHDFDSDKSVTGRIGLNPMPHLHLSASAMRTGNLDATGDGFSEIWIGNIVFRPIGSDQTTKFHAEIGELDAIWSWNGGHVGGAIGRARYDDNDPLADNSRNISYYQLEAVQNWTPKLYAATRYSRLRAHDGYPLAGLGNKSEYFFGPWSTDIWRLSLGGGYRFNPDVLFKLEYAWERGDLRNGNPRENTDLFSAETVVGF